MPKFTKCTIAGLTALVLASCGGGGSGGGSGGSTADEETAPSIALFIDSAVTGLEYSSASHQGVTGTTGAFLYEPGETTTFSFNGLVLGSIATPAGSSAFTPLDLFATNDVNNQSVKNTLVFLQSLDSDQNPANGISLPSFPDLSTTLSSLDITSSNFQSQLLSNLGSPLASVVLSLVSEADAIANFEKTLITLNATIGTLDGKWVMRDTKHGDVDAVYEFSANNELAVTEYEDCSDNAIYWAAASASAERNCTSTPLSLNWQLSGKVLTMSNSSISDSCTIISSTPYLMEASCTFTGGEGGIFLFERVITSALSNNLINNSYREVSVGTLSYTTQTFSSDLTGSYKFLDENGITSLDDTGTFTWSTSASQLSFAGTDGASATFSDTIIFEEAVNGAISADVKSRVLIPDFDTNIAAVGINHNTWGIYDAINGNCKKIYNFNTNTTPLPLRKFDNTSSNADHCTVPSGGLTLPDSLGGADDYSVLISKGAFVIEKGSEREICWPIKYINISEDSDYIVVACAVGVSPFAFEIWRQI